MRLPALSVLVLALVLKINLIAAQLVPQNTTIAVNLASVTNSLPDRCKEKKSTRKCQLEDFRPFDGTCSNLADPIEGSSNSAYTRIVPANYADGLSTMRKSVTGQDLPLPRLLVTNLVLPQQLVDANKQPTLIPNAGSVIFGQLLTHDVASKEEVTLRTGVRCCKRDTAGGDHELPRDQLNSACSPIVMPKNDTFYSKFAITCMHLVRSQPVTPWGCPVVAQQLNQVTSLLDLSVVYGSSKGGINPLRTMKDGLFNLTAAKFLTNKPGCTDTACFRAAEPRANQTPFLLFWHLIWHREHNRIAKVLKRLNPTWTDERIFQETRQLVIALYQHSIYKEYLPAHLSQATMQKFKLEVENEDFLKVGHVDVRTTNEFAQAIFRRFHNLLPGAFNVLDKDNKLISSLKITDVLNNSKLIEKLYDSILRGMLNQTMNLKTAEEDFSFRLFANDEGIGLDLFSIDIQRGRDHGLAPYHVYREKCGLKRVDKFEDLHPIMSQANIANLREHYASVFDIDLVVGAGLEETNGEILGPTVQCIMADQFHRYKFGDPYFYTNRKQPQQLDTRQMAEVKKFTIARLFCDNSGLKMVPRNAFLSPSARNPMVKCTDVKKVDLSAWRARKATGSISSIFRVDAVEQMLDSLWGRALDVMKIEP